MRVTLKFLFGGYGIFAVVNCLWIWTKTLFNPCDTSCQKAVVTLQNKKSKDMKKRHLIHFHVAGFAYWDGSLIFKELEIGTKLQLFIEKDNKFDAYAVALYYKEYKLGYIPRGENKDIYKFCEQGYQDIFEVVINRVSPEENPEEQIGVVMFLKNASL